MANPDAIKEAVAYVGQLVDELEKVMNNGSGKCSS